MGLDEFKMIPVSPPVWDKNVYHNWGEIGNTVLDPETAAALIAANLLVTSTKVPVEKNWDPTFVGMAKIPRLNRLCWITEKLDGTNAQVVVTHDGNVLAGSRSRYIVPNVEGNKNDNHGFAQWVEGNKANLLKLGPGRHFGEWWGKGINRGYEMKEKIFSLFNVERWSNPDIRPQCCSVVPVLLKDDFGTPAVNVALDLLRNYGSWAAPGFMKPEGIVIFHVALNGYFKVTLENDETHKTKDM